MKKIKLFWYLLTIIPIVLLILGYVFPLHFFSSQDSIREFVNQFGIFAPIIFILIQILQVIITPFSHYTVSIAGGFIFGTWLGFLYNLIGRVIGTAIAFYLGRIFGRKIIKYMVKPETIEKYDYYFDKGKLLLFLAYFLPLFPDDEISYLAGFSAISPKIFLPLMAVGHIGGSLSLSYLGNGVQSIKEPMFIFLSLITLIGGIWFAWHYREIKK
ncbi:VTT domain-containing protein [Patescibacteria group bacterium]|nr:VTT domain-containing protein [Patescibacteria group bacterium]MBU2579572.1 VTT domain-containing protein [Patescibacteria group bacterium]MBU4030759.1 VTT domain-containing protein [Patescibacteria group bacterium]MBU4082900.1 VTT domain-containing protein [Patescibacteria group bacterium]